MCPEQAYCEPSALKIPVWRGAAQRRDKVTGRFRCSSCQWAKYLGLRVIGQVSGDISGYDKLMHAVQDVCEKAKGGQSHTAHRVVAFEPYAPAALFLRIAVTALVVRQTPATPCVSSLFWACLIHVCLCLHCTCSHSSGGCHY